MILIAAIAVGCIAAFVVLRYVGGVEDRVNQDAERVPVLVVRADIAQGTPGDQAIAENLIVEDEIAREFLPATRITDFDQIAGKVALVNLAANQVLVDGMFVDPAAAQVSAITQRLEGDSVAMSISVDSTRAVGGLLVPGDLVNIMYLPAGEEEADVSGARMVYHQARILAIGAQSQAAQPAADTAEGTLPLSSGLITLDLPVDAAQLIASLPTGNLMLTLTGPDYAAQPIPPIEVSDLDVLPGETDARTRFGTLTPYGPDGPQ